MDSASKGVMSHR